MQVTDAAMQFAADLAAHFSKARGAKEVRFQFFGCVCIYLYIYLYAPKRCVCVVGLYVRAWLFFKKKKICVMICHFFFHAPCHILPGLRLFLPPGA
jgi:hypothetical protein